MKIIIHLIACFFMLNLSANPVIYAIAGSPASGKTTFVQEKSIFFPEDVFYHDCDSVMVALEGYQADVQLLGSAKAFQKWELPAREKAEDMLKEAVEVKKTLSTIVLAHCQVRIYF